MYAQFDVLVQIKLPGHGTGAYGQDYALHCMLLQDELAMAGKALGFLANYTKDAGQRYSRYNFFERMEAPPLPNMAQVGCGELNLVNAMAPIKAARIVLGVDDTNLEETVLRPRLPPGWGRAVATDWPVLVSSLERGQRVVRVNITVVAGAAGGAQSVTVEVAAGEVVPRLCVRLGSRAPFRYHNRTNVTAATVSDASVAPSAKTDDDAARPVLFWVSYPVLPGETVVLAGAGFGAASTTKVQVVPLSQPAAAVSLSPAQVTDDAVKVTLPRSLPLDAYNISVDGSADIACNAPDLWWAMGDAGNASTAGGWARVFGRGLSLDADRLAAARGADPARVVAAAAAEMAKAAQRGDFAEVERLAAEQTRHARQHAAAPGAHATTLTLTPTNGGVPITVAARIGNLSTVSALFPLPSTVPPGEYFVTVSNGAASGELRSFRSENVDQCSGDGCYVRTLTVRLAAVVAFPARTFPVSDYGCDGGAMFNCTTTGMGCAIPINATLAVRGAIAAAGAAGGGTVLFGIGRWYVSGALLLPDNVLLKGAGMDLTMISFAEDDQTSAPAAYFAPAQHTNTSSVRYGVQDLAIDIRSFYKNVFEIGVDTDGVRVERVRIRANAFHCQDTIGHSESRGVAWTWIDHVNTNALFTIRGRNFVIHECDLWATWQVVSTPGPSYNEEAGGRIYHGWNVARSGVITRNKMMHGGACHWFDSAREILWESNECQGNNVIAMGNTIATYSGGYQQHIYLGSSSDSGIYGNDRETMTYDNAGNTYFGRVRNVSADGLKYSVVGAPQTRFNRANIVGGVMVVITGTGAGQYRRITSTFSDNQFTIDTPLAVPVATDGAIEVMPLRGRNIFYNQHYEDVGPFQFYGTGIDNIVYGLTMARGGGIAAWGQWRSHFGNPNLRNQFLGCTVLEGLRGEHQETPLGTGGFGDPLAFNGHVFAIAGAACGEGKDAGMPCEGRYYNQTFHTGGTNATLREMNRLIVFRRNEARSNGGFWLGPAIDVLVEGNTVSNTPAGSVAGTGAFPVSDASRGVLLLNNRCNNGTLATASKLGGETAPATPLKSDDRTPPYLNGIFLRSS